MRTNMWRVRSSSLTPTRTLPTRLAMGLAAGMLALGCAAAVRADEVAKTFTVSGHARVSIETDDGAVRVSTGDIKQVEVRIVYSGYKVDRDLRISTEQNGDSVSIAAKTSGGNFWSWGVRHTSLRVEVHMPKDADLTVKSGDGHIDLEGRFDGLNIHTGDGSVTARAGQGSKVASGWTIHTGDGSVDLEVPGDLKANLDASTHDGHISLGLQVTVEGTFSSSRIHGTLNGGGQPLTIATGDGSIHLSKT